MIDRDTVIAMAKQAVALRFSHPYRNEESHSWAASTDNIERFAKLVEQKAIDSQKQLRRETEAMAECMDMVRQDLITAGVVDKSVPPMMLAEAVIAAQQKALLAEREACAQVGMLEAINGIEVSAAIRARGTGGEG